MSKAATYPSGATYYGPQAMGRLLFLLAYIRRGWRAVSERNTLAYFVTPSVAKENYNEIATWPCFVIQIKEWDDILTVSQKKTWEQIYVGGALAKKSYMKMLWPL